jgi:hypothetical protein
VTVQVRAPDGTIIRFPDGTPPATINQVMGQYHAQALALADARAKMAGSGPLVAFANGRAFNFAPEISGAVAAFDTAGNNLVHTLKGEPKPYGAADMYHATAQATREEGAKYAAQHPGVNLALNVTGAAGNPANVAAGKYVAAAGKVLPAIGRSAATGAALGAGYGAGSGGPGGRAQGATQGAATGAAVGVALPVAGAAAERVAGGVAGAGRNIARAAGVAKPADVARQRLAAAVAKDIKAGVDPQAALANWPGESRPTLADVGGENVRATVRDAGSQGPARQTLTQYRDRVAADLQDNAIALTNRLTPNDARPGSAVASDIERRIADASTPPVTATPGQGGALLSQALNERAAQARQAVDDAYAAARAANPEQAQLPKSAIGHLTASVREAVADYAPSSTPNVRSVLSRLDALNAPTARDLFEIRSQLSNLRVGAPSPETAAASRAVGALDAQINSALDGGLFTGDPSVVRLWQNANALRRSYGQQFEGGDLIHDLTAQDYRGGGRNLVIAPEDASNAILGRNGVNPRANLTRDFGRVVDLLGDNHPAVQAVRNEAASRLLSADAGSPDYGTAFQTFQQNNPAVAGALLPDLTDPITSSRAAIARALTDQRALDASGRVLNAAPDAYVTAFGDANPAGNVSQVGARQALIDAIGRPTEGAVGALNRISTATNPGQNLSATFGADTADNYRQALAAEISRMSNANYMAPNTGSQTASKSQDLIAALLHGGHAVAGFAKNLIGGGPLTDAERSAIVSPAIDDLHDEVLQALLRAKAAPVLLPAASYAAPTLSAVSAGAGR